MSISRKSLQNFYSKMSTLVSFSPRITKPRLKRDYPKSPRYPGDIAQTVKQQQENYEKHEVLLNQANQVEMKNNEITRNIQDRELLLQHLENKIKKYKYKYERLRREHRSARHYLRKLRYRIAPETRQQALIHLNSEINQISQEINALENHTQSYSKKIQEEGSYIIKIRNLNSLSKELISMNKELSAEAFKLIGIIKHSNIKISSKFLSYLTSFKRKVKSSYSQRGSVLNEEDDRSQLHEEMFQQYDNKVQKVLPIFGEMDSIFNHARVLSPHVQARPINNYSQNQNETVTVTNDENSLKSIVFSRYPISHNSRISNNRNLQYQNSESNAQNTENLDEEIPKPSQFSNLVNFRNKYLEEENNNKQKSVSFAPFPAAPSTEKSSLHSPRLHKLPDLKPVPDDPNNAVTKPPTYKRSPRRYGIKKNSEVENTLESIKKDLENNGAENEERVDSPLDCLEFVVYNPKSEQFENTEISKANNHADTVFQNYVSNTSTITKYDGQSSKNTQSYTLKDMVSNGFEDYNPVVMYNTSPTKISHHNKSKAALAIENAQKLSITNEDQQKKSSVLTENGVVFTVIHGDKNDIDQNDFSDHKEKKTKNYEDYVGIREKNGIETEDELYEGQAAAFYDAYYRDISIQTKDSTLSKDFNIETQNLADIESSKSLKSLKQAGSAQTLLVDAESQSKEIHFAENSNINQENISNGSNSLKNAVNNAVLVDHIRDANSISNINKKMSSISNDINENSNYSSNHQQTHENVHQNSAEKNLITENQRNSNISTASQNMQQEINEKIHNQNENSKLNSENQQNSNISNTSTSKSSDNQNMKLIESNQQNQIQISSKSDKNDHISNISKTNSSNVQNITESAQIIENKQKSEIRNQNAEENKSIAESKQQKSGHVESILDSQQKTNSISKLSEQNAKDSKLIEEYREKASNEIKQVNQTENIQNENLSRKLQNLAENQQMSSKESSSKSTKENKSEITVPVYRKRRTNRSQSYCVTSTDSADLARGDFDKFLNGSSSNIKGNLRIFKSNSGDIKVFTTDDAVNANRETVIDQRFSSKKKVSENIKSTTNNSQIINRAEDNESKIINKQNVKESEHTKSDNKSSTTVESNTNESKNIKSNIKESEKSNIDNKLSENNKSSTKISERINSEIKESVKTKSNIENSENIKSNIKDSENNNTDIKNAQIIKYSNKESEDNRTDVRNSENIKSNIKISDKTKSDIKNAESIKSEIKESENTKTDVKNSERIKSNIKESEENKAKIANSENTKATNNSRSDVKESHTIKSKISDDSKTTVEKSEDINEINNVQSNEADKIKQKLQEVYNAKSNEHTDQELRKSIILEALKNDDIQNADLQNDEQIVLKRSRRRSKSMSNLLSIKTKEEPTHKTKEEPTHKTKKKHQKKQQTIICDDGQYVLVFGESGSVSPASPPTKGLKKAQPLDLVDNDEYESFTDETGNRLKKKKERYNVITDSDTDDLSEAFCTKDFNDSYYDYFDSYEDDDYNSQSMTDDIYIGDSLSLSTTTGIVDSRLTPHRRKHKQPMFLRSMTAPYSKRSRSTIHNNKTFDSSDSFVNQSLKNIYKGETKTKSKISITFEDKDFEPFSNRKDLSKSKSYENNQKSYESKEKYEDEESIKTKVKNSTKDEERIENTHKDDKSTKNEVDEKSKEVKKINEEIHKSVKKSKSKNEYNNEEVIEESKQSKSIIDDISKEVKSKSDEKVTGSKQSKESVQSKSKDINEISQQENKQITDSVKSKSKDSIQNGVKKINETTSKTKENNENIESKENHETKQIKESIISKVKDTHHKNENDSTNAKEESHKEESIETKSLNRNENSKIEESLKSKLESKQNTATKSLNRNENSKVEESLKSKEESKHITETKSLNNESNKNEELINSMSQDVHSKGIISKIDDEVNKLSEANTKEEKSQSRTNNLNQIKEEIQSKNNKINKYEENVANKSSINNDINSVINNKQYLTDDKITNNINNEKIINHENAMNNGEYLDEYYDDYDSNYDDYCDDDVENQINEDAQNATNNRRRKLNYVIKMERPNIKAMQDAGIKILRRRVKLTKEEKEKLKNNPDFMPNVKVFKKLKAPSIPEGVRIEKTSEYLKPQDFIPSMASPVKPKLDNDISLSENIDEPEFGAMQEDDTFQNILKRKMMSKKLLITKLKLQIRDEEADIQAYDEEIGDLITHFKLLDFEYRRKMKQGKSIDSFSYSIKVPTSDACVETDLNTNTLSQTRSLIEKNQYSIITLRENGPKILANKEVIASRSKVLAEKKKEIGALDQTIINLEYTIPPMRERVAVVSPQKRARLDMESQVDKVKQKVAEMDKQLQQLLDMDRLTRGRVEDLRYFIDEKNRQLSEEQRKPKPDGLKLFKNLDIIKHNEGVLQQRYKSLSVELELLNSMSDSKQKPDRDVIKREIGELSVKVRSLMEDVKDKFSMDRLTELIIPSELQSIDIERSSVLQKIDEADRNISSLKRRISSLTRALASLNITVSDTPF